MRACLVLVLVGIVAGDIYMHNPRGSNNRLNENTSNRRTANRVFDSQNNNKGGYNVGDAKDSAARHYDDQYHMKHFMSGPAYKKHDGAHGTWMDIEWTNQHACGGNEGDNPQENMHCHIVIQMLCRPSSTPAADLVRDGTSTSRQDYSRGHTKERKSTFEHRKRSSQKSDRALHELFESYDKCYRRKRNKGLFTADQKLKYDNARSTRQNPNGNQNGFECPEERDYYPYWHPSEWKDIAVLAENTTWCQDYYQKESFNVNPKWECVEKFYGSTEYAPYSAHNNKADCQKHGGQWLQYTNYLEKAPQYSNELECEAASKDGINFKWARPMGSIEKECLVMLDAPECKQAPWSRDNHLGNGIGGQPNTYKWQIPYFPSEQEQRCVLRLRYNISTADYNIYNMDHKGNAASNRDAVIENDPEIDMGVPNIALQLAINTAQFGRTFQDRTHFMEIRKRPRGTETRRIHNLNVRGKRGNIVQVYPAVEYDFVPTNLKMKSNDLVHIQWTGSNTHDNNNDGDDGEGRGGTDRHNIVQIAHRNSNYPLLFDEETMFKNAIVHWSEGCDPGATEMTAKDVAIQFATSGYVECLSGCKHDTNKRSGRNEELDSELDNAPASFSGMLLEFQEKGKYHYMCSRNNNFSNRSQKGTITVEAEDAKAPDPLPRWGR